MPYPILLRIANLSFTAELNDTAMARKIHEALPIEARGNRWGDEIYFSIDVKHEGSDPMRDEMQVGELAYWPPGKAFCIFWGPTPASEVDEPRAASNVVPVGRILGDCATLSKTKDGQLVVIERRND